MGRTATYELLIGSLTAGWPVACRVKRPRVILWQDPRAEDAEAFPTTALQYNELLVLILRHQFEHPHDHVSISAPAGDGPAADRPIPAHFQGVWVLGGRSPEDTHVKIDPRQLFEDALL